MVKVILEERLEIILDKQQTQIDTTSVFLRIKEVLQDSHQQHILQAGYPLL